MNHLHHKSLPVRQVLSLVIAFLMLFTVSSAYGQGKKADFATVIFTCPTFGKSQVIKNIEGKTEKVNLDKHFEFPDKEGEFLTIIDQQLASMDSLGFKLVTTSAVSNNSGDVTSLIYTFKKP